MKLAITCCLLAVLVSVGCRRKRSAPTEGSASGAAPVSGVAGEPGAASQSAGGAQVSQGVPTLKGVAANSDNPMARALAGNDPQAHLRVLNELVMVFDQTQGKPPMDPEDFVKVGLLSRVPTAPLGMKFIYNPSKRLVELAPAR